MSMDERAHGQGSQNGPVDLQTELDLTLDTTNPASGGLRQEDALMLARVADALQLIADLSRADVLLFAACSPDPRDQPERTHQDGAPDACRIVAEAKPNAVPSLSSDPLRGRIVTRFDEPVVFQVWDRRKPAFEADAATMGVAVTEEAYPIIHGGHVIGVLSIRSAPLEYERQRKKDAVWRRAMADLRQMVLRGQLDGCSGLHTLGEHDGLLVVDSKGRIRYLSTIAEHLYRKVGYREHMLGMDLGTLTTNEGCFYKAMENGTCVEEELREGSMIWRKKAIPIMSERVRTQLQPGMLRRTEYYYSGAIIVITDLTEEREQEQELWIKSMMIREIHHRVKNNLQTIASLLRMQARRTGSPEVSSILNQTISRILSIAVVHESLSQDAETIVNLREVGERILQEARHSVLDPEKQIEMTLSSEDVMLNSQQATPSALVLNELVQNALEHAFADRSRGTIKVTLCDDEKSVTCIVDDDGNGLPYAFNLNQGGNLGLQIVQTLVHDDLKGSFVLLDKRSEDGTPGARAVVTFPKLRYNGKGPSDGIARHFGSLVEAG